MEKMPKVSVLMPCYNHEEYVGKAIESVLNQSYSNIELIVADNASTDNSYQEILKYKDGIKKIIRMKKNNPHECNYCLDSCVTGDYVALMTSDDYWEPDKIELQVKAFSENPNLKACLTWAKIVEEDLEAVNERKTIQTMVENRSREEWLRSILEGRNYFAFPSCVVEREAYFHTYSRGYRQIGDLYLYVHLLFQGDIYIVPKQLVRYRWHVKGDNKNESVPTRETMARTMNEWSDVTYHAMENMPNDLFKSTYQDLLINPDVEDEIEIACEKLFVLQKIATQNIDFLQSVMRFFYNHFKIMNNGHMETYEKAFPAVLFEKYSYSALDFSRWSGKACLSQVGEDFAKYRSFVEDEKKYQERKIASLKKSLLSRVADTEMDGIRKELFLSLSPTIKRLMKELCTSIEDILRYANEEDIDSETDAYRRIIEALNEINGRVEGLWAEFMYAELEVSGDDWNLYKELLQLADVGWIDLNEAVLPFLGVFKTKMEGLWR